MLNFILFKVLKNGKFYYKRWLEIFWYSYWQFWLWSRCCRQTNACSSIHANYNSIVEIPPGPKNFPVKYKFRYIGFIFEVFHKKKIMYMRRRRTVNNRELPDSCEFILASFIALEITVKLIYIFLLETIIILKCVIWVDFCECIISCVYYWKDDYKTKFNVFTGDSFFIHLLS